MNLSTILEVFSITLLYSSIDLDVEYNLLSGSRADEVTISLKLIPVYLNLKVLTKYGSPLLTSLVIGSLQDNLCLPHLSKHSLSTLVLNSK